MSQAYSGPATRFLPGATLTALPPEILMIDQEKEVTVTDNPSKSGAI
jgi:hypothetical protein